MSWTARDGRTFATAIQRQKYEQWKDTEARAPGGLAHEEAVRLHGPARSISMTVSGNGRFEVTSKHADGFTYKGVHPQAYVAHDVIGHLSGVNAPIAVETHNKARQYPTGPKEYERQNQEYSNEDKAE